MIQLVLNHELTLDITPPWWHAGMGRRLYELASRCTMKLALLAEQSTEGDPSTARGLLGRSRRISCSIHEPRLVVTVVPARDDTMRQLETGRLALVAVLDELGPVTDDDAG